MSDATLQPLARTRVSRRLVAATVAGNALEFYDFVTYAFFAVYIGRAFFPASTPMGSLLLSVAVFGVGFLARPLGGLWIGAFADRVGRKPAMLLTIALISIGTLGLALTPSYDSIGLAAPVTVVVCRLVQGLALGGEVGPSTAYLIEIAPSGQRGLFASWQIGSQGASSMVAGLIGLGLTAALTPEQMQVWGWRVPFLLGLLLVPIGLYLRRSMPETLHGGGASDAPSGSFAALMEYRRVVLLAILVILGGTVATYVSSFMTTFAITTLKLPPTVSMAATVMSGVCIWVFALLGGWACDRWGRRPIMVWPRLLVGLMAVPAFAWLTQAPSLNSLLVVTGVLTAMSSLSGAAMIIGIPELLPRRLRATGLSVAYAVGVSLFGGTTQFVLTWLIAQTGNPVAPAWYLLVASVIGAAAAWALPETGDEALKG